MQIKTTNDNPATILIVLNLICHHKIPNMIVRFLKSSPQFKMGDVSGIYKLLTSYINSLINLIKSSGLPLISHKISKRLRNNKKIQTYWRFDQWKNSFIECFWRKCFIFKSNQWKPMFILYSLLCTWDKSKKYKSDLLWSFEPGPPM